MAQEISILFVRAIIVNLFNFFLDIICMIVDCFPLGDFFVEQKFAFEASPDLFPPESMIFPHLIRCLS